MNLPPPKFKGYGLTGHYEVFEITTFAAFPVIFPDLPFFFSPPQLGPFFVLKFVRSWGISSTVSKVRIDRKVLSKNKKWPLIAVNGR